MAMQPVQSACQRLRRIKQYTLVPDCRFLEWSHFSPDHKRKNWRKREIQVIFSNWKCRLLEQSGFQLMYSSMSSTYLRNWDGSHTHPKLSWWSSRSCAWSQLKNMTVTIWFECWLVVLFILMDESSHIAVPADVSHSNSFAKLSWLLGQGWSYWWKIVLAVE